MGNTIQKQNANGCSWKELFMDLIVTKAEMVESKVFGQNMLSLSQTLTSAFSVSCVIFSQFCIVETCVYF